MTVPDIATARYLLWGNRLNSRENPVNAWKMMPMILAAGFAAGCGGSDQQTRLTELCRGEGMSESVCDCTTKRFLDNVSEENATLTVDLITAVKDVGSDDPTQDPIAAMRRGQARIQKVADEHGMSTFELTTRAQSAGAVYKQAQAACLR